MIVPVGKAGHFNLYTNRARLAFARMHRPLLDHYNLSMNALLILKVLDENPEVCTPKELVRILGLKSNVVYLHVDQLVEDGYLERRTAENDHRKIVLTCTRKAAPVLKKAEAVWQEYVEVMSAGISQEELEVYQRILKKMETNIDSFLGES